MDPVMTTLTFSLLTLSVGLAMTQNPYPTTTPPKVTSVLNQAHPAAALTVNSNLRATTLTDMVHGTKEPITTGAEPTETSSQTQSSPQPSTSSTSLTTEPPKNNSLNNGTETSTTQVIQTTGYHGSTTGIIVSTTHLSNTSTTSDQGPATSRGLKGSERTITIVFSVVLGVFAVGLGVLGVLRCKRRVQYLHGPVNDMDDIGVLVEDGPYDRHPIYDNVPPTAADQSRFRLDFLS